MTSVKKADQTASERADRMIVMRFNSSLFVIVIVLMIVSMAPAQAPESNKPEPKPNQSLKVDVDLVLVNAAVTDPHSRYVTGLEPEHFRIWEDKVEQKIEYFSAEDVPLTVGIIFDVSGSMKDKLSAARDAAVTFLKTGNPDDEYFLIEFSNRPQLTQDLTTDIAKLQNRLVFTPAKGMTAVYDAVYMGLEKLKEGANSKKALLLISDGEDNRSRYNFSNLKEFVREQDVQIYSIGIVDQWPAGVSGRGGRPVLEELSGMTGGRAFFPDSVHELEDICMKIALELKNQYVIGYRSANEAKDGKWRKLQLKINSPKGLPRLNVRAKAGYYAAVAGTAAMKNKD